MPSHTVAERRKNQPAPRQDRSPVAKAPAKIFGEVVSPPISFKENLPSTLPVPEMPSPLDRPQFTN